MTMDMWGQLAKDSGPIVDTIRDKIIIFLEIFVKGCSSLLVFMPTAGNFFVRLKSCYFTHWFSKKERNFYQKRGDKG